MKLIKKTYLVFSFLLLVISINAQEDNICIKEILKLENKLFSQNYTNTDKTIYMNYVIQTTDWNGKYISSNVKIYRHKLKLHFFSKQANMFQDEKNSILVLKPQKVVVVNATPKNIPSGYSDEFVKLRVAFLKSCKVLKCKQSPSNKNIKILELKSMAKKGALKIDRMIYTYNVATGKILKSTTYYQKGFQVKKIVIDYKTLDFNSNYKFTKSAKKYVLGKSEKLLTAYKGYELVDNTK